MLLYNYRCCNVYKNDVQKNYSSTKKRGLLFFCIQEDNTLYLTLLQLQNILEK